MERSWNRQLVHRGATRLAQEMSRRSERAQKQDLTRCVSASLDAARASNLRAEVRLLPGPLRLLLAPSPALATRGMRAPVRKRSSGWSIAASSRDRSGPADERLE